jgi:hypothetical protein
MAIEPGRIEDRLRRLEALTAILLVYQSGSADTPQSDEIIYRLLRTSFREGPDDLYYILLELFDKRRREAPSSDRLQSIEKTLEQLRRSQGETANISERQSFLERDLEYSRRTSEHVVSRQSMIQERVTANQQETHLFISLLSMGLNLAEVRTPRLLPVRVYLGRADQQNTITVAKQVERLLATFGFVVADDFPAESGSWWKKWFVKTKNVVTQPEMQDRLQKVERALETWARCRCVDRQASRCHPLP